MHRKILFTGIALTFFVGFPACERHDWEETKKLHQPHGGHGHDHDDHHGEAETDHAESGKADHQKESGEAPAAEKAPAKALGKE